MDVYAPNRFCGCTRCWMHGLWGPAMMITLGLLFILDTFNVADFSRTWPLLLIVIGGLKVLQSSAPTTGHRQPMTVAQVESGADTNVAAPTTQVNP
jgi:hypothetical protein